MLEQLIDIDRHLLVALNGSASGYWDGVMWLITKTQTWIPLLLVMLYIVLKNSDERRLLLIMLAMGITIALADRLSSGLIKPLVMRWRPTHDAAFLETIDTVFGYTGGRYGFVSSHAANTFSLFVFVSLLLRSRLVTACMLLWACVSSYSRVYLGVHYPGDILCGALLGMVVGALVYWVYDMLFADPTGDRRFHSASYTTTGFRHSDMHLLALVLLLTYAVVLVVAIPVWV